MTRRQSIQIKVGDVTVGGGAPVRIQSMVKEKTTEVKKALNAINRLKEAGCEIIRVAVPNESAVKAFAEIKKESSLPLVADIHFVPRLAQAVLAAGADKVRINPGNMKFDKQLEAFFAQAAERGVPVRLGVNSGSVKERQGVRSPLEPTLRKLLDWISRVEKTGFRHLVLSYKASSVTETVAAYRRLVRETGYPLHLGLTASGTTRTGMIKSALALGILLAEGIGDTIRVSLAGSAVDEVGAAWEILHGLGLRKKRTPEIMACPTCGRAHLDTARMADRLERLAGRKPWPLKVAVMGCEVNGPGEAGEADVGVAGYRGGAALFVKGKKRANLPAGKVLPGLVKSMREICKERSAKRRPITRSNS